MTKEQAIQELCSISVLSGDFALITENTIEALSMAIDALREPSLPDDLEEAASSYIEADDDKFVLYVAGECDIDISNDIKKAILFGAKWQASQGHTINAVVNVDGFYQRFIQPSGDIPFECGDKLIVTLRKR